MMLKIVFNLSKLKELFFINSNLYDINIFCQRINETLTRKASKKIN